MFGSQLTVLVVISLVCLAVDGLGTSKIRSAMQANGQHRQRRQLGMPMFYSDPSQNSPCFGNASEDCSNFLEGWQDSSVALTNYMTAQFGQRPNPCLLNQHTFSDGRLINSQTSLLTPTGIAFLSNGNLAPVAAAAHNLLPTPSVSQESLLADKYAVLYRESLFLTALGCQALAVHHITLSQLGELGLYPLPSKPFTLPDFIALKYTTKSCLPTLLGLSCINVGYLQAKFALSDDCPFTDDTQISQQHLMSAQYTDSASNLITPLGLAAMQNNVIPAVIYMSAGVFPFNSNTYGFDPDATEYSTQAKIDSFVGHLIKTGYVHPNSHLLSIAAAYSIQSKYMTIDDYRQFNLWPCKKIPTVIELILAGYLTYGAQLTHIGNWFFNNGYLKPQLLYRLGIQMPTTPNLIHQMMSNPYMSKLVGSNERYLAYGADLPSSQSEQSSADVAAFPNPFASRIFAGASNDQAMLTNQAPAL